MRRFKIKYTSTKGVLKTRNIKASSEAKAMSEITDMQQHHYTITETVEKNDMYVEEPKETWEVGDMLYCIKSGKSHSRNEPYVKGKVYECSHFWQGDTFGITGLKNIVDKKNFRKATSTEILVLRKSLSGK